MEALKRISSALVELPSRLGRVVNDFVRLKSSRSQSEVDLSRCSFVFDDVFVRHDSVALKLAFSQEEA